MTNVHDDPGVRPARMLVGELLLLGGASVSSKPQN